MMKPSQYQLTNAADPDRAYTFVAKVAEQPDGSFVFQLILNGPPQKCSAGESAGAMRKAVYEIGRKLAGDGVEVEVEVEDPAKKDPGPPEDPTEGGIGQPDEPEPEPLNEPIATPPVAVSNVAGVAVEVREAGYSPAAAVPRPAGWPTGDTF